jgi:hypothetical protein
MTPDEIADVFGSGFLDDVNKNKRMMRRDYGLVEFTFSRGARWACTGISIQLYRLARHGDSVVPRALLSAYGPFPVAVKFMNLEDAIRATGAVLEAVELPGRGFEAYLIAGTSNRIYVVSEDGRDQLEPNRGDVWGMSIEAA